MTPEILGIVGFLIVIALGINAFFIRDLVEKINDVRLGVAVINSENKNLEKRINIIENSQVQIFKKLHRIESKGSL